MIRSAAMAILFATSFVTHASEQATAKADPAKGKIVAETICVACHGADGNSMSSANPHLAGQIEQYIYKQLSNFKTVDGNPALRDNAIMAGMAAALTEEDMKNVAAWFASQKLKPESAKNEASLALGKKIWRQGDFRKGVPACAGCHGPAGSGMPAQYPRLAGQFAEYTEAQLVAFRAGTRANDPESMMRTIAAKLSDAEIKAVADYAAGLR
ncbi:c-type cytochrome [Azonexus caeni]|jgi:cbb3-type cytochrome c oxidase subunit III|uniref:c-type cytochrome n=1 Tax=Azonexus caeni TaxID=266126 RepID=UPI003A8C539B